ncbi:MAG: hypothetical protein JNK15_23585 [Planctomycetes bacterium]|nr:hypothetical protein [Planctomycetota bacterium]
MSGAVAATAWLPKGPWQVDPGYVRGKRIRGWLLRCVALAIAVAYAFFAQGEIGDLRRDAAIADDPAAIEVGADFDGRVESRWGLFAQYRGTVRFRTADGRPHSGKVDFSTMTEIDTKAPLTVRFVPGKPDEFVISWAAAAVGSRWLSLVVLAGFGLVLFPGMLWWLASGLLAQAALALALAVDGEQHVLRLVRVEEHKQYGRLVHRRFVAEMPGAKKSSFAYGVWKPKEGTACLVPPDGVLVVSSPLVPRQVLMLRHDLWPLRLPDQVRQEVLARLAAAAPPNPN